MKKVIRFVLVAALCLCGFAGCGQEEQKETEPQIIKTFELKDEKITAENVSPYSGRYLETDDLEKVTGVYAMQFTNTGDKTIQSAQLVFSDGTQELSFWLEMLPAGQTVLVAEQTQAIAAVEQLQYVDGTVTYLEGVREDNQCVQVTDNKNGTVQVTNVTKEALPLVRVFYRCADENGVPMGGPCKSILIDGIDAGASLAVEAEGWEQTSVVVTVLVINE